MAVIDGLAAATQGEEGEGGEGGVAPSRASVVVRVGEDVVQCELGFKLFFTTLLSSPPLGPAVSSRVAVVNFAITQASCF